MSHSGKLVEQPPLPSKLPDRLHAMDALDPVSMYAGFDTQQLAMIAYDLEIERLGAQERVLSFEDTTVVEQTLEASRLLMGIMEPTPLETSGVLSSELGFTVLLKREDLTPVHSFKIRGAYNCIAQLSPEEKEKGVIAASAGNHAQGVALSAQLLGLEATIVMPVTTSESKVEAVKALGANVELFGKDFDGAFARSQELQEETSATYIHPFDASEVIIGQSVVALEIIRDNPDVTHIFVPVGGGGLLAGVTRYVKALRPDITIIGVEPEGSNAMGLSVDANSRVQLDHVGIFSEGTAVKQVAQSTFEASRQADGFVSVTDDEISTALADFIAEKRAVLETAGALGIAGLRKWFSANKIPENSVAVAVCSGANIDNSHLLHVLERAELASNRLASLRIELPEHPGALLDLCRDVINSHNITKFEYRKRDGSTANILIDLRVASSDDTNAVQNRLTEFGYQFADLSDNSLVREHGLQTIGNAPDFDSERFYSVEFADRPGALLEFLESLGTSWNISMFHYGGSAGDVGRVLIGFENPDNQVLEKMLETHTKSFEPVDDEVAVMFG